MKKFDVVTFGSAVIDIFVDTDVREKGKFMAYPVGSKILVRNMKFNIGGGGTNAAVAFSRLGLRTGYIGKLDADFGGRKITEMLKRENIEFLGKMEKNPDIVGGYSIILDSRENDRTILTYKGVNDDVGFSDAEHDFKTKWFYVSSSIGESFRTVKRLAESMHKHGVKIAFNPSEYMIKNENLKDFLKICDIISLNKEEAELLTKKRDLLFGLHELGPRIVVITNKDKEITAYDGIRKYELVPHKIKIAERTGAGDAFASGFVAGQITGKSVEDSLRFGLEESESVIKHRGAKIGLIRRKLK
ncbi:MAG: carbohydrate kinase family protein [Candidatus Pacearchaeota archaeon]|nr:carbohydrate kinase family protein [Candidatus Pacearchaeota archaeon]MDE1848475.1 carbohydrate kinase family protein [Nanoarchaeota archaeon]